MAQKTLQRTPQAAQPKKAATATYGVTPAEVNVSFPKPQPPMHDTKPNNTAMTPYIAVNTVADFEAEDERLWQQEFNGSLDILSDLADQALADYEAGRTTKISV